MHSTLARAHKIAYLLSQYRGRATRNSTSYTTGLIISTSPSPPPPPVSYAFGRICRDCFVLAKTCYILYN